MKRIFNSLELRNKILFQNSSKLTGVPSRTAIQSLCFFAKSKNIELRMRALEKLGGHKSVKVSRCLTHALRHEKNPLILIAAMESAKDLKLRSAINQINDKLVHQSPMVRGYAAITLSAFCGRKICGTLKKRLLTERSSWAKAAFHIALHRAGGKDSINHLIRMLASKQYRVRIFIVNGFNSLNLSTNRARVIAALKQSLKAERTIAVSSAIKRTIRGLTGILVVLFGITAVSSASLSFPADEPMFSSHLSGTVAPLRDANLHQYDRMSRAREVKDPAGNISGYTYDALGRLIKKEVRTPAGDRSITEHAYDPVGNMLSASDGGSRVEFAYDALNRPVKTAQTFGGGTYAITYAYDAVGNRTGMTTPWGEYNYTYDALNRLTSIVDPQGINITFAYDGTVGNISAVIANSPRLFPLPRRVLFENFA